MFVHDRIVIEIDAGGFVAIPADVVLSRVLPPLVECAMVIATLQLIEESQTETRTSESVGPDLGVFTMAAVLTVVPLPCEILRHARVCPLKCILTIPDH